jgi:LuxR family transcriptional regulator, maltose regulon positive regulatory protein
MARDLGVPSVGVIAAKLAPPRLPGGSISRPRLVDLMRTGRDRALTLVSAPAGYGKTTMLAGWAAEDPSRAAFAWMSLDSSDADPVRLWTHIIASLQSAEHTEHPQSLAALRAHPDEITARVLPVLFNELGSAEGAVVMILDDYHLAESAAVNEQIASFLRYRPPRIQLVVASRSDPALGVARLRLSDELVEVRAADLAFDSPELAEFFEAAGVTGLSESDKQRLADRTGGWPAPLRLAALLMPDTDHVAFIDSFTGGSRQVVDYLTQDVLDVLAPEVRDFLLQVSVLGRLNGPLCDAVIGTAGSGEMLASLERANLFVSADAHGEWYQQHNLFAEALRLELGRTRPELVPVLHARAAQWFADQGDRETATEHAIAARNVPMAGRLVAGQLQVMAATGRSGTTRRWLAALDWPEAAADPELAFVRAVVAGLSGHLEEAQTQLGLARSGPADQQDAAGLSLAFRVDFLEAFVTVTGVGQAERAARRAIENAPSPSWRGVALAGLGQSLFLQGRVDEAVPVLRESVGAISEANPILLAIAVGNLGLAESARGDASSRADVMLDELGRLINSIEVHRTWVGALLLLARGERERRRGDLRAGLDWFDEAIEILESTPRGTWLALAYFLKGTVQRSLGNTVAAAADVDRAEEILDRIPDPGSLRDRCDQLRLLLAAPVRVASEFGEELSDRELDVLRLSAAGLDQRHIAAQLFISYNTVKSHLKASYRKLGVSSRADALRRLEALDEGNDPPPHPVHPGEQHEA